MKLQSQVIQLENLMVANDIALPFYNFNMLKKDDWQVTCSIPSLNVKETVSGGLRYEVRELVAEKVLSAIKHNGVLNV